MYQGLPKQEEPDVCWDFFSILFFRIIISRLLKKRVSQQTFGPSHFVRALASFGFNSQCIFETCF